MNIELICDIVSKVDKDFELATVKSETLTKFVELIVRECDGIANNHAVAPWAGSDWGLGFSRGAERISEDIKKHFGVE